MRFCVKQNMRCINNAIKEEFAGDVEVANFATSSPHGAIEQTKTFFINKLCAI